MRALIVLLNEDYYTEEGAESMLDEIEEMFDGIQVEHFTTLRALELMNEERKKEEDG